MTALRKILIEEETVFTAPVTRAPAKLYVVANNATPALEEGSAVKNIVLFFLAPFIGLAYMVLFPLAGLVALAVLAGRSAAKYEAVRVTATVAKNVGLAVAAPAARRQEHVRPMISRRIGRLTRGASPAPGRPASPGGLAPVPRTPPPRRAAPAPRRR